MAKGQSPMTLPLTMIVPAWNRKPELERAIASLASQSAKPERIIVIDDGSDTSVELGRFEQLKSSLEVIRHATNRGAAAARNTGMEAAESDWISFLDSDDFLQPTSLAERWGALQGSLALGSDARTIFGSGWYDVDQQGKALNRRLPRPGGTPRDFASGCWFSPGSCVIVNRKLALAVGLQDESLRRFEDLDWFLRLALDGFTFQSAPIFGVAITRQRSRTKTTDALAHRAAGQLVTKWTSRLQPDLMRRLKAYLALELGASSYFAGHPLRAARSLVRSFALAPRFRAQLSPGWEFGTPPFLDPTPHEA